MSLGRAGFALSFARHPLFAGLICWLVTRDAAVIPPAIFFELVWLDLFFVGTYVPPSTVLAYLVYVPLMLCFNLQAPLASLLLLLLCLPLPVLGAQIEQWHRGVYGLKAYETVLQAINTENNIQAVFNSIVVSAVVYRLAIGVLLHIVCSATLFFVLWFFGVYLQEWPVLVVERHLPYNPDDLSSVLNNWGLLWAFASIGALLSLRISSAKICFLAGALGVFAFLLVL